MQCTVYKSVGPPRYYSVMTHDAITVKMLTCFLLVISMLAGKHWQTAGHVSEDDLLGMKKLQ